jgi:hypothetical protein
MAVSSNLVFNGLHVVAWVIFVGLCIEAGGWIVNFIVSLTNPDFVQNLYQKLDITELYANRRAAFFGIYSFVLSISVLKAFLFFLLIRLMHKIDLARPFSNYVSNQITTISYYTISIGLLSIIAQQYVDQLQHRGYVLDTLPTLWTDGNAFILMGAVMYVIATIFKRGVDLQNDTDLTV